MKKFLLFIFIISVLVCTSCGRDAGGRIESESSTDGNAITVDSDTLSPVSNTPFWDDIKTDKFTPDGIKKIENGLFLLDTIIVPSEKGIDSIVTVDMKGNFLISSEITTDYSEDDSTFTTVILYDIVTGKKLSQKTFDGYFDFKFLDNEGFSAICPETLESYILNSKFEIITHLEGNEELKDTVESCFITSDGKYICYTLYGENVLSIFDISTEKEKSVKMIAENLIYHGIFKEKYLISYFEGKDKTLLLDAENAVYEAFNDVSGYYPISENALYSDELYDATLIKDASYPDAAYMFKSENENLITMCMEGSFLLRRYVSEKSEDEIEETFGFELLDIANGLYYDLGIVSENQYLSNSYFYEISDNGAVGFCVTDKNDNVNVYIFNPFELDPVSSASEIMSDNAPDDVIDKISDNILTKYGIEVYYGTKGNDFDATDYVAQLITSQGKIYKALRTIDDTLSCYPNGIFKEMLCGDIKGLKLYLCGNFYATDNRGISSAAAIAFNNGDYHIIAMDITLDKSTVSRNLTHELMHTMEKRFAVASMETDIPYLNIWDDNAAPAGAVNGYFYSYHDEYGGEISDTKYTAHSPSDDDTVWFIDPYSRTFPEEDRARIMETLILFSDDPVTLSEIMRGENLLRKARLLCALMRETYPSVKNAENVIWENGLDIFDPNEFDHLFIAEEFDAA